MYFNIFQKWQIQYINRLLYALCNLEFSVWVQVETDLVITSSDVALMRASGLPQIEDVFPLWSNLIEVISSTPPALQQANKNTFILTRHHTWEASRSFLGSQSASIELDARSWLMQPLQMWD